MQNYLSDHGQRNKRYNSQVNRLNELMRPVSNYLSDVKGRIGAFMDSPSNALYDAYSKQIGVNLDLPISEYAKMAQNPQPGKIDPNSPAMREAMSWLPGPADNIGGLLGIIAGPKSKNAKLNLLDEAKILKSNGFSTDDIYYKTGWWLDHPDGIPRFEIDDSSAIIKNKELPRIGVPGTIYETKKGEKLSNYLSHAGLDEAYPGYISDLNIGLTGNSGVNAYYDPSVRSISLDSATEKQGTGLFKNLKMASQNLEKEHHPVLFHELQHGVQDIENMSRGGSINEMQLAYNNAYDAYNRLAGEAEARLVQNRINLTPKERMDNPFYKNFDVPIDLQIIKRK